MNSIEEIKLEKYIFRHYKDVVLNCEGCSSFTKPLDSLDIYKAILPKNKEGGKVYITITATNLKNGERKDIKRLLFTIKDRSGFINVNLCGKYGGEINKSDVLECGSLDIHYVSKREFKTLDCPSFISRNIYPELINPELYKYEIVSYKLLWVTTNGHAITISNKSNNFSEISKKAISKLPTGSSLTFTNIIVRRVGSDNIEKLKGGLVYLIK